jgi:photosystem II stability/assembly factor-like uncharacterized protein
MTEKMEVQGMTFEKKWYNQNQIIDFITDWMEKNGSNSFQISAVVAQISPMLDVLFTEIQGTINDDNTMTLDGDTYTMTSGTIPGISKPNSGTGGKWTEVKNSPLGGSEIRAIAYGNGTFVAGGKDGKMAYSADGVTWTPVSYSTFGSNDTINAIAYGNGRFVAGGGGIATSTDGKTWKPVTTNAFNTTWGTGGIEAIAYGNGRFVAGGSLFNIATSTDGETWTAATSSLSLTGVETIAFGNNTFVAVSKANNMAYSTDNGASWTSKSLSEFGGFTEGALAFGKGTFVAGIYSSTASDRNASILTSTDGITWKREGTSPFGKDTRVDVIAYANNKFITVGGTSGTATSTDGKTWKVIVENKTGNYMCNFSAIAYGSGKFVGVGAGFYGENIAYLSDN